MLLLLLLLKTSVMEYMSFHYMGVNGSVLMLKDSTSSNCQPELWFLNVSIDFRNFSVIVLYNSDKSVASDTIIGLLLKFPEFVSI